jgi:hypothetical protein
MNYAAKTVMEEFKGKKHQFVSENQRAFGLRDKNMTKYENTLPNVEKEPHTHVLTL